MGKGTGVKGNADIDLLMILPEETVNSARELEDKLEDIKDEIKRFLPNDQHPGFTVVPEIGTKFAVQFTVKKGRDEIKVDLLPTFNFTGRYKAIVN